MTTAKTIAITAANAAKIVEALKAVNGKAHLHAYTEFSEIEALAEAAEAAIAATGLPKASRAGAIWHETSGAEVAKSYRNPRQATAVKLVRLTAGWHFHSATATQVWEKGGGKGSLWLTQAQADEAKARFAATLNVIK